MLNIIEPKDHQVYQTRIDSFLSLLKIYQNFSLSQAELKRATFMIASDNKRGVYGGALLYQQHVRVFDDKIDTLISTLYSSKRKVWSVNLCFCIEEDEPFSALEQLDLCQSFYQNLFRKFIKFGKQEKTRFFVLSLRPTDFFKTKTYGHWPYLLEIQPKESLDGLFHGILALKSDKHKIYKNTCSAVDCLPQLRRESR